MAHIMKNRKTKRTGKSPGKPGVLKVPNLKIENRSRASSRQWRHRGVQMWIPLTFAVIAGGRLKIDQKARECCDASEFNKLNIDLPKGKLLQGLRRIYRFTSNLYRIQCVLIHDTLKRIRVRRIRKSANSMWPSSMQVTDYGLWHKSSTMTFTCTA
jgi:hypothetical protein